MSPDLPKIPERHRSLYAAPRRKLFRPKRSQPSFAGSSGRNLYSARRRGLFGRGGGHSSHSRRASAHSSGGRRWPKRLLIGSGVAVVLLICLMIASYFYIDSKLQGIPRVAVSGLTPAKSGQPLDVLLVGSDSRSCETNAAQAKAFGSKTTQTGQRADTIMVARFLSGSRVEMFSIPRDTWVPISGTDASSKINAAFNNGPSQLVATIQKNFGIPINHVAMVNFCGFPSMVSSLGGLYMNFADPVTDPYTGLNVRQTGCQLVTGPEALALVRSRHLSYYAGGHWNYDGMSDFSRIQRQQAFFHALIDRVHQVIPDVFRLNAFVGATIEGLSLDNDLSSNALLSLGWHYHSLSTSNLFTSLLPTTESVINSQDVLLPAPSQDKTVINAFLTGNTGTFSTALGARDGRPSLASSSVVTGHLNEPWNPTPC